MNEVQNVAIRYRAVRPQRLPQRQAFEHLGAPMRHVTALLLLAMLSSACALFPEAECTPTAVPAIRVRVVDASTGANIAPGATVVVSDGAFTETWTIPDDPTRNDEGVAAALERPGIYRVVVSRERYRPWDQSKLRATEGRCHVNTIAVTARLVPD